uniref:Uncharacterized protein n=1 Tax=Anguilla anguilla TaxID=7936 RepID=A0A0E9WSZ4_ANGAN
MKSTIKHAEDVLDYSITLATKCNGKSKPFISLSCSLSLVSKVKNNFRKGIGKGHFFAHQHCCP